MSIQWDPRLSVGVRLIDDQHQELFRRVNALLAAMEESQGAQAVDRTLSFLDRYVKVHFGAEEKLMAQHLYPQEATHRGQHEAFVKTFLELKAEYQKYGATQALAAKLDRVVCGWLRHHIGATDRQLGQFLLSRGERASA